MKRADQADAQKRETDTTVRYGMDGIAIPRGIRRSAIDLATRSGINSPSRYLMKEAY